MKEYSSLESIKGIQFTAREIDVMACLLVIRSNKAIASCLKIEEKTVEHYMRTLRNKIKCYSREGIIRFIEKSGTFSLFRQHFQQLLANNPDYKFSMTETIPKRNLLGNLNFAKTIVISCGCIIGLSIFIFINKISTEEPQTVRSDLLIPTETTFLKRPELVAQIEKRLDGSQGIQTVALVGIVGMGGVGKTTIARYFGRSQKSSVVWEINAESHDSLINSFNNLAHALAKTKDQKEELDFIQKIQDSGEKDKRILDFVKQHLKRKEQWFLIYDNVESLSDIKGYFPHDLGVWGNGKVIITTRDSNIKNTIYIASDNIIAIDELSKEEALTLFSKILYGSKADQITLEQKEKATAFLENIPPFPLDVSMAACYIKDTQITYEQYLEKVAQYSQSFEKEQQNIIKEMSDYAKTRYGIITSSLEKIININPIFKELLLFICLLDSQNIPKELLNLYKKDPDNRFIHNLKKYSLITSESSTTLSLHRSTQILGRAFLLSLFSKTDKKMAIDKIIFAMKSFYDLFIQKNHKNIIKVIPHLEVLLKNLESEVPQRYLREKYEKDLSFLIGYSYKECANNFILAKKYLTAVYIIEHKSQTMPTKILAILLKDLGEISTILSHYDESLLYCKESNKLCETISNVEILMAQNLKIMANAHQYKNDFKEAIYYLESALGKISSLDNDLKKETESSIYAELASVYSGRYINRREAYQAEKYAFKSLEVLNASETLSDKPNSKLLKRKISCYVAKNRGILGQVYSRLGKYNEAMIQGFKEAEYIMEHSLDNCGNNLAKAQILLSLGEISLRSGQLDLAEKQLTNAIHIREILVGKTYIVGPKIYRAEVKIRLGKLEEAYEDCSFVFKTPTTVKSNHFTLLCLTCYYHAAIIKCKQGDLEKSLGHFVDFFKEIKAFCQSFLDEKEYQDLELKDVFSDISYGKSSIKEQVARCLHNSTTIFTAIYGSDHPFVRDYVQKNCCS